MNDNCQETALVAAVVGGSKRCVQLLLANGANPHARNMWGETPASHCRDQELRALMGAPPTSALVVQRAVVGNVGPSFFRYNYQTGTSRLASTIRANQLLGLFKGILE